MKLSDLINRISSQLHQFTYTIKAVGYGYGYDNYPVEFQVDSIYDIEEDEKKVIDLARKEIDDKGVFRLGQYKIIHIKKVHGQSQMTNAYSPSGIRH